MYTPHCKIKNGVKVKQYHLYILANGGGVRVKVVNRYILKMVVAAVFMSMCMFGDLPEAHAATGYEATHASWLVYDAYNDLGGIAVSYDNLPNGINEFTVKLPSGFELSSHSLGSEAIAVEGNGYVADLTDQIAEVDPTDASVEILGIMTSTTDNRAVIRVNNKQGLISSIKFVIKLDNVFVPAEAPDIVYATIIASPGSVFNDGIIQVAQRPLSINIFTLSSEYVTVTPAGCDRKATIYLREWRQGDMLEGADSVQFTLPEGFAWEQSPGDCTISKLNSPEDDQLLPIFPDERTVSLERTTGMDGIIAPASIWAFECSIIPNEAIAQPGEIMVSISSSNPVTTGERKIGSYYLEVPPPEEYIPDSPASYSATHVPRITPGNTLPEDLGSIIVTYPNMPAGTNQFMVMLPPGFSYDTTSIGLIRPVDSSAQVDIEQLSSYQAMVTVSTDQYQNECKFAINISASFTDADFTVVNSTILGMPGSIFPDGVVQIAIASGPTQAIGGDWVHFSSGVSNNKACIYLSETQPGGVAVSEGSLTLRLPVGFSWDTESGGFEAHKLNYSGNDQLIATFPDDRTMNIQRTAGSDDIVDPAGIWKIACYVAVDEALAQQGDVYVTITGTNPVTPDQVTIASYGEGGPTLQPDVNGDGATNITDAVLVLKYITQSL